MTPADEERFKIFIQKFIDTCGIDPPFHVVVLSSNGSVSVQHHTDSGASQVCQRVVAPGFTAPLVLTVIGSSGVGKSSVVTIETAMPVLQ